MTYCVYNTLANSIPSIIPYTIPLCHTLISISVHITSLYMLIVVRGARIQAMRPLRAAPLAPVRQEQRLQGVYEETRLTKG